jgi:hypothetical protein
VIPLNQGWFPFLSPAEFEKLTNLFSDPPRDIMPHQLAVRLGIDLKKATLIITTLSDEQITNNFLLIYHVCDNEMPVGSIGFGEGFPPLPWSCPNCEEEVDTYSELNFDLLAKLIIAK